MADAVTKKQPLEEASTAGGTISKANEFLLEGVRVLGLRSRNKSAAGSGKRRYLREACEKAIPKFEGQPVNLNHDYTIQQTGKPRKFTDMIGTLQNVKCDNDGLTGDIQLNPKMPLAEAVKRNYEHNTNKVGISFLGEGSGPAGSDYITDIDEVFSVDIVQDPSTSQSLREAAEQEPEEKKEGLMEAEEMDKMLKGHESRLSEAEEKVTDHHSRLAECENKLAECVQRTPVEEAVVREQATQIKQLLAEVALLKAGNSGGTHIHPKLNPEAADLDAFVAAVTTNRKSTVGQR